MAALDLSALYEVFWDEFITPADRSALAALCSDRTCILVPGAEAPEVPVYSVYSSSVASEAPEDPGEPEALPPPAWLAHGQQEDEDSLEVISISSSSCESFEFTPVWPTPTDD